MRACQCALHVRLLRGWRASFRAHVFTLRARAGAEGGAVSPRSDAGWSSACRGRARKRPCRHARCRGGKKSYTQNKKEVQGKYEPRHDTTLKKEQKTNTTNTSVSIWTEPPHGVLRGGKKVSVNNLKARRLECVPLGALGALGALCHVSFYFDLISLLFVPHRPSSTHSSCLAYISSIHTYINPYSYDNITHTVAHDCSIHTLIMNP